MKKVTSTLGLFALAVGTAAAFAMSPAPKKATEKAGNTLLHWFDANGNYSGQMTSDQKEEQCGPENVECARGYVSLDPNTGEGEGNPTIIEGQQN